MNRLRCANRIVLLLIIATLTAACGSSVESSQEPDNVLEAAVTGETDLPVLERSEDEDGPSDLAGMVDEAQMIFEARVVAVEPGLRYYGPNLLQESEFR